MSRSAHCILVIEGAEQMKLYKCENCGRLYGKPVTIDYGDEKVRLCPICGERTQGIAVEVSEGVE